MLKGADAAFLIISLSSNIGLSGTDFNKGVVEGADMLPLELVDPLVLK